MNTHIRERLKFFTLILLIIASLIQVGILWKYQNQNPGFPISFLDIFFSHSNTNDSDALNKSKADYFLPYSIVATEKYTDSHWLVEKGSDEYDKLWHDSKELLKSVLNGLKAEKIAEFNEEEWGKLVIRKPYVFSFKTAINVDIVRWFLDIQAKGTEEPGGILNFIISPSDEENNNNDTLYISDGVKIYTYSTTIPSNSALYIEKYQQLIEKFSKDVNKRVFNYSKEFNVVSNIDQDILISIRSPKSNIVNGLVCSNPEQFQIKQSGDIYELEQIGKNVIGDDSYDPDEDNTGAAVFKKTSSIYRISDDGLLEYNYRIAPEESDKGELIEAFKKALIFINGKRKLLPGVNIYLSGISENKSKYSYTFTFDYSCSSNTGIGEIPITFSGFTSGDKEKRTLKNAITIDVNSKKVLNCWWIFKDFERDKKSVNFNINFAELYDVCATKFPELRNKAVIKDVSLVYNVRYKDASGSIVPEWQIASPDKNYTIQIQSVGTKEGD